MYQKYIRRLYSVNLFQASKVGLNNTEQLHKLLGCPSSQFKSIHVAGTNGKGSVTTKVAKALQRHGYKVGHFTSPHIACFRERIRVNGEMIPEESVCKLLDHIFEMTAKHNIAATFFEITTLLAFCYFAETKVDFAVIETGLGGRLDATNVITPILSVITSVSLDHTEVLGNTLEDIAKEKAGIIKVGIPTVIGPHTPKDLLQTIAIEKQSPCHTVNGPFHDYIDENRAIAQKCLEVINVPLDEGIHENPPCRFEIIQREIPIILDVGHNPDGLQRLFQLAKTNFPQKNFRILFALSKNKDIDSCLKILQANGSSFHIIEAANGRSAHAQLLLNKMLECGTLHNQVACYNTVQEGLTAAIQSASHENEILLICGSFFIMADAREALGYNEPRDPVDLNERWNHPQQEYAKKKVVRTSRPETGFKSC